MYVFGGKRTKNMTFTVAMKWVFAVAVKNRDDVLPLNLLSLCFWVQWTVRQPNWDTALEQAERGGQEIDDTHTHKYTLFN